MSCEYLVKTLEDLSKISAPSGYEDEVVDYLLPILSERMDKAYVDKAGNVIGVLFGANPEEKKVVIDAHMDEIGLMVTAIEEGFLRFRTIGGVGLSVLPNRMVKVMANPPRLGLITALPPHVQTAEEQNKAVNIHELFVDVGLSQENAEKEIEIGTPMVFESKFSRLLGSKVTGKALDDRCGIVSLLRTVDLVKEMLAEGEKLPFDLYFMASRREEIGGAGAFNGVFGLAPDAVICVDVTHGITPDSGSEDAFASKRGPVIAIGPNMHRALTKKLVSTAEKLEFDWQGEVMGAHSGTNAWGIQVARDGIPTAVLSIPLKYMHSPQEVIDMEDVSSCAQVLAHFLRDFDGSLEVLI